MPVKTLSILNNDKKTTNKKSYPATPIILLKAVITSIQTFLKTRSNN